MTLVSATTGPAKLSSEWRSAIGLNFPGLFLKQFSESQTIQTEEACYLPLTEKPLAVRLGSQGCSPWWRPSARGCDVCLGRS